jgi:hypothetical protein
MIIVYKYSTKLTTIFIHNLNIKTAGVFLDNEGHKINANTFKA